MAEYKLPNLAAEVAGEWPPGWRRSGDRAAGMGQLEEGAGSGQARLVGGRPVPSWSRRHSVLS